MYWQTYNCDILIQVQQSKGLLNIAYGEYFNESLINRFMCN